MPEDIKKKKEEEMEEELKKEKKPSWIAKVPTLYKLLALGLLYIKYQSIVATGGNINELYTWVGLILIGLYLLGTGSLRREPDVLTPEDAEISLKKELLRKQKEGQIDRWAKIYVGPNNGLFFYEGMPKHYQIGVEVITDGQREYKRGIVDAEGNTKGYATVQDHPGKVSGRELIPTVTPRLFKLIKKYQIDIDKFLFGEKK